MRAQRAAAAAHAALVAAAHAQPATAALAASRAMGRESRWLGRAQRLPVLRLQQ